MAMSFFVVSVDLPSSANFVKISLTKLSVDFFKTKQKPRANDIKMRSKFKLLLLRILKRVKEDLSA